MGTLFRREAIDHQRDRFHGAIVLAPTWSSSALTLLLCASVGAVVAFACLAGFARKEFVTGILTPDGGLLSVVSPQAGVIASVHVVDGQEVSADPMPDADRIELCAHVASIDAEIQNMPMGYNTLVGEVGIGISGGQIQRILLARALYRQPRILVLDEATSHLDMLNERNVNDAVKAMQLTRVIVAHRPETIAMADRVLVMERGRLAPQHGRAANEPLDVSANAAT